MNISFANSISHKTSQHLPFVISNPRCFWNTHNTFWVKGPLQKLPGRAWAQLYHWQKAHTLPLPLSPTLRMLPEATWSLPKRWDFKISGNDKKRKNEPGNLWWRHLTGSGGDKGESFLSFPRHTWPTLLFSLEPPFFIRGHSPTSHCYVENRRECLKEGERGEYFLLWSHGNEKGV